MSDSGFLGCLVLDMSSSCMVDKVLVLLQPLFHSNVLVGNIEGIYSSTINRSNFKSGVFILSGHVAPSSIEVPSRSSVATSWLSGSIINADDVSDFCQIYEPRGATYSAPKLLVRVNSTLHNERELEKNYAQRIMQRVHSKLRGRWSQMLVYLSTNPVIILSRHGLDLYMSLVYTEGALLLVWSDVSEALDMEGLFVYRITPMRDKELLVIHPMYLLSKVRKWGKRNDFNYLKVLAVIDRYLHRIAI